MRPESTTLVLAVLVIASAVVVAHLKDFRVPAGARLVKTSAHE